MPPLQPPLRSYVSLGKVNRLLEKRDKLREEALAAEAKAIRLRKQARQLLKKVRELSSAEDRNIEGLEIDEAAAEALKPPARKQPQAALSSTGLS
jgi:hypothetical protein